MGILNRIWSERKASTVAATTFDTMNHDMVGKVFGGAPTHAGKMVTANSALALAANWSCMRLISEVLGSIPWTVMVRDAKRNAVPAEGHMLQAVLGVAPNIDQTPVEFKETIGLNLSGNGNVYSLIGRLGRDVTSLTPLLHSDVRPMRKQGSNTKLTLAEGMAFYRVTDRGRSEDLPREKVWHVKLFGHDRLVGLSPIGAARESIGGALAMEEFGNRFFAQGGMPAGTVSYPGWLTPDQREVAKKHLQELLGGLGKAHQFAMFEGGVEPKAWNAMSFEDMQFIMGRRFNLAEICRFQRVPPHLVYDLEKASYASIEQMNTEFLIFTLLPYFSKIEAAVSRWLLPAEERGKVFLKFNPNALLRPTTKERYEAHSQSLQNGWLSRNEVRALEDLGRIEGLDDYTCQVNLTPVEDLRKVQDAKKPAPAKDPAKEEDAVDKGARGVTTNILLPETLRHEVGSEEVKVALDSLRATSAMMSRSVEAGNLELANELERAHKNLSEVLARTMATMADKSAAERGEVAGSITALSKGIEELARVQKLPRRPVFDDNGNLLRSEVVETAG